MGKRLVSSQEIEEALKSKDNQNIMNKIILFYKIPSSDQENIKLHSLWRCLAYYQKDKNTKFTTNLTKFTIWECCNYIKKYKAQNNQIEKIDKLNFIEDKESLISEEEYTILNLRFIFKMSFKEISKETGIPKKKCIEINNNCLEKLRCIFYA